jgi:hypothetical protein
MQKYAQWLPLLALLVANQAPAPTFIWISNTNGGINNFYAPNLATALNFSNVTLTADNTITVVEDIDLSVGVNGLTAGRLALNSTTILLDGDVTMGTGALTLNAATVNLNGAVFSHTGAPLGGALLTGLPSTVNVLSNDALLQQAVSIARLSGSADIDAPFGTSTALLIDRDVDIDLSGGLISGTVDFLSPLAALNITGLAFQLDTGSGYAPVGTGAVSASAGSLRGTLFSGDSFEFAFSQLAPQINLTLVPEPSTVALTVLGLVSLASSRRSRR